MKRRHPIEELIAQGEHQQLDFKFEVSDSKKIARTLSAFANTDGGRLLIGVKDNGAIAGVRSDEEYYTDVCPDTDTFHLGDRRDLFNGGPGQDAGDDIPQNHGLFQLLEQEGD